MKLGVLSPLLVTLAFVCSFGVDGKYTTATDSTFDSLVLEVKDPVAVIFCAVWKGICRQSIPALDQEVSKNPPVTMVYVNIDKSPELAEKNQIREIPTVYGFYNGELKNIYAGPVYDGSAHRFVDELINESS